MIYQYTFRSGPDWNDWPKETATVRDYTGLKSRSSKKLACSHHTHVTFSLVHAHSQ